MLWLFFQTQRATIRTELNDAISFRIADTISKNTGPAFEEQCFAVEIQFPVENVVAENQRSPTIPEKARADEKRLGNTCRLWLHGVFELNSESRTVPQKIL